MDCKNFEDRLYFDTSISPEYHEAMQRLFTPYIWYRTIKDDEGSFKACWCSCCGGYFEVPKSDKRNYRKKHRDTLECKHCGEIGTMICKGRMRSYSTLNAKGRAVFAKALDKNTVEFRCFYMAAEYDEYNVQANIVWTEDARYILSRGEAVEYVCRDGEWKQLDEPREPWTLVSGYSFKINHYVLANPDELRGTFLEYADIKGFEVNVTPCFKNGNVHDQPAYMKYLCAFCRYPVLEYLMRYGCYNIISDFIYLRIKHGKYLRWSAKTILDFCKMPKRDAIRWISEYGSIEFRYWYDIAKSFDEACEFYEKLNLFLNLEEMCDEYGADKRETARYLIRQNERDTHLLSNYWRACDFLGRDTANVRVKYPKKLREAHDEFTSAMNRIREESIIRDKTLALSVYQSETLPKYRRLYDYCTNDLCAMIPEQLSDIALEGNNMHHCVAGYTDRHAQGKTIIVFIRNPMYPLIPKWTAEISPDGELKQVQGYNNRPENKPDEDGMAFINEWLQVVKARFKNQMKTEMKKCTE